MKPRLLRATLLVAGLTATLPHSTSAAIIFWTGSGTDANWLAGSNWSTRPVDGDNLVFTGTTRQTSVNNLPVLTTLSGITFGNAGFNITGNALTLTGDIASTGSNTYGIKTTLSGNRTITSNSGVLTLANSLSNSGNLLITGAGNILLSGSLTGSGSLTKSGTGTLTLNALNTYTGATSILDGAIALGRSNNSLNDLVLGDATNSSGKLVLNGFTLTITSLATAGSGGGNRIVGGSGTLSTLTLNNSSDSAFSGILGGAGTNENNLALVKSGTGILTLSGNNTFTGGLTINAGSTVKIGSVNAVPGKVTFGATANGSKLQLNGVSITIGGLATNPSAGTPVVENNHATAATLTLNQNASTTYAGILQDGAAGGILSIKKTGTGTLTLSGVNTYTGTSTISQGALSVSNLTNALGSGASAIVLGDATNTGTLSYTGTTSSFSRGFTVSAGGGQIDSTVSGQTLSIPSVSVGNAGAFTVGGAGNTTISSNLTYVGTGSLNKTGSGNLTLSGANTYTGAVSTNIRNGTIILGVNDGLKTTTTLTLGDLTANTNGVLKLNGYSQTLGSLLKAGNGTGNRAVGGNVTLSNLTLDNSGSVNFGGILGGTGTNENNLALTKTNGGILTLSGTNTYTGGTTISAGTFAISAANNLGATSGILNLGTGTLQATANITSSRAFNLTDATSILSIDTGITYTGSGVISGTGALNLTGLGTLVMSGTANTYSGGTFIKNGVLTLGANNSLPTATALTLGNATISGKLALNGYNQTVSSLTTSGSGTNRVVNGKVTSSTFTVNNDTNITFGGILGGTGTNENALAFTKSGAGILTLNGANTYIGDTTISGGILQVGIATTVPTGVGKGNIVISASGTLDLNNNGITINGLTGTGLVTSNIAGAKTFTVGSNDQSSTFAGIIQNGTGTVALTKTGTGTLTLSGANAYSGNTTVTTGTLKIGNAAAIPSGIGKGNVSLAGALDLNGTSITLNGLSGAGGIFSTVAGAVTLSLGANDQTASYSGIISNGSGTLSLSKVGTGILTLSGVSTFTGATLVKNGTLAVGVANALPTATILTLGDSSTNDSGILKLSSFAQTLSGLFTAGTGTDNRVIGGSATVATLTINNSGINDFTGILGGSGTNENNFALAKSGSGTLTLSGDNTFTGGVTINSGGILQVGNAGALNSTTPNKITFGASATSSTKLQLNGYSVTIGPLAAASGSPSVENANATDAALTVNQSTNTTYAGIIQNGTGAGTLSLTKTGTGILTLSGINTYSAGTIISQGTLSVGTDTSLGAVPGSPSANNIIIDGGIFGINTTMTLNANRGLALGPVSGTGNGTIDVAATRTLTYGGIVTDNGSGTGALVKTSTGILTLASTASTYSGGTTVAAGLLNVTATTGTPLGANVIGNDINVSAGANLSLSSTANKGSNQITTVNSTSGARGGIGFSNIALTQAQLSGMFTDNTGKYGGVLGINSGISYATALDLSTFGSGSSLGSWFLGSASTGTYTATSLTIGSGNIYRLGGGNGNLTLSKTKVLTGANSVLVGFSGTNGTGNVTLSLAQDYTGTTTVAGGTLSIGGDDRLGGGIGPGNIVLNGGALSASTSFTLNSNRGIALGSASSNGTGTIDIASGILTYAGIIANNGGTGSLTKTGAGTLTLSGNQNTYTGATNLNGGILSFSGIDDLGAGSKIAFNGGTLLYATGNTDDITARTVTTTSAGGATIDTGNNDVTFASSGISGTGIFTKLGSGTLTLNAVNIYTGATNINNGTVKLGINGALPATSILNLNGGAASAGTLDINGLDTTVTNLAGTSSTVLGRIINSAVGSDDILTVNSAANSIFSGIIADNGGVGGTISLVKTGASALTLGGTNTYTGGTTISTGILTISKDANLGSVSGNIVLSGGATLSTTLTMALDANRGLAIGPSGATAATLAPSAGTTLTYNGIITNIGTATGGLIKSNTTGTLILGGANTYAGNTTISGGVLKVDNVSAIPSGPGNGNVSIASTSNGAFDLNGNAITINGLTGAGTIRSNIAGPASLTVGANDQSSAFTGTIVNGSGIVSLGKTGTGTLTLSGTNTYSGGTTISGGTLVILADNNIGGIPGSAYPSNIVIDGGILATGSTMTLAAKRGIAVGPAIGSGDGSLAVGNGTTLTYGGIVADNGGTGGLTKTNTTGTLVLSGANTYSGDTTISGGTLQLGNVAAIPSGTGKGNLTLATGSTLDLNNLNPTVNGLSGTGTATITNSQTGAVSLTVGGNNANGNFGGIIQDGNGTVSLTKTGSGTLTLAGLNTYTGNTTISGGVLQLGLATALPSGFGKGNLALNGALDLAGYSATVNGLTGSGIVSNSSAAATILTAGANDQSSAFSGSLQNGAGTVALTKTGTGTLTLSGNNTYSGATTITTGTLSVGSATALSGSSTITIANVGFLDLNGFNVTIDGLAGSGTILNNGASPSILNNGAGGASTQFDGVIADGTNTIALTKSGAGTLTLTGVNTYSGTTTIGNGTVSVANPGSGGNLGTATSAVILGDATNKGILAYSGATDLTFTRGFTVNSGGGQMDIASPGKTLTLQTGAIATTGTFTIGGAGNAVVSSIVSGSGGFTKANTGNLILSSANTYTGDTTISSGTLQIGNAAAIPSGTGKGNVIVNASLDVNTFNLTLNGISGSGTITNSQSSSATLTAGDNNASSAFAGVIQDGAGAIALVKTGTGVLTLSGNNAYTGATTVNAGTLLMNGALNNSNVTVNTDGTLAGTGTVGASATILGTHAPGNQGVGTQSVTGELTYRSNSIFAWEIQSPTAESGASASNQGSYDQVNAGALSGTDAIFKILLDPTNTFDDNFWDTDKTWNNIFNSSNGYDLAAVFSNGFAGSVPTSGIVPGQGQFTLAGNSLNWSAVPEPKDAGALALLLAAGLLRRQRRPVAAANPRFR